MNVVILPRGGGKTWKLLECALWNPNLVIVSHNKRASDQLRYTAAKQFPSIKPRQFISWDEARDPAGPLVGRRNLVLAIDNADLVLQGLVRQPIEGITVTG